jgi:hypothetical protein
MLSVGATGCDQSPPNEAAANVIAEHPTVVDSIFPIEEEIRRFRAAYPHEVKELSGGALSKDELVTNFVSAADAGDRQSLASLVITPEEFVYLYYPHTRYTAKPYQLSPSLVWFELESFGLRGLDRLLQSYDGKTLGYVGYECPGEPQVEDRNRIWNGCVVRLRSGERNGTEELKLFGPILERDGKFKFLTYANGL